MHHCTQMSRLLIAGKANMAGCGALQHLQLLYNVQPSSTVTQ